MWKKMKVLFHFLVLLAFASSSALNNGEIPKASWTPKISSLPKVSQKKQPINESPKEVIGCGITAVSDEGGSGSRIYGGEDTVPNAFPWQAYVSIQYSTGSAVGGGTLISDFWVMTAGHLTFGGTGGLVQLGSYHRTSQDSGQVYIEIDELITHPQYQGVDHNDIGLIKLISSAPYTASIHPICLPSYSDFVGGGVLLTVTGWGTTSSGSPPDILQMATVTSMTTAGCAATGLANIDDTKICTTAASGVGTCIGDSGGPLSLVSGGKTYSVGTTSFVVNECGGSYPNGFTRTTAYLTWISSTTNIVIDP